MEGSSTTTVATLLSSVGDVFTQVISWAGTVGTTIVGNPVLLLYCIAVPLCGIGVGMFARLLHSRG